MHDFDAPSYNGDVPGRLGHSGAEGFRKRLEASDAFVISAPECKASMPGVLKNALDWISRFRPQPLNELHGPLLSASPSMIGGNRSLWALRMPFEHLGRGSIPTCSRSSGSIGRLTGGQIADPKLRARLEQTIEDFMDLVEASKH